MGAAQGVGEVADIFGAEQKAIVAFADQVGIDDVALNDGSAGDPRFDNHGSGVHETHRNDVNVGVTQPSEDFLAFDHAGESDPGPAIHARR